MTLAQIQRSGVQIPLDSIFLMETHGNPNEVYDFDTRQCIKQCRPLYLSDMRWPDMCQDPSHPFLSLQNLAIIRKTYKLFLLKRITLISILPVWLSSILYFAKTWGGGECQISCQDHVTLDQTSQIDFDHFLRSDHIIKEKACQPTEAVEQLSYGPAKNVPLSD